MISICISVLIGAFGIGDPSAHGESPSPVDAILQQVEERGAGINDLQCSVVYVKQDEITDDRVKREGTIAYKRSAPNPRFLVTFEKSWQEGTANARKRWYLFDGRWLFEAIEQSRSIIRRDLAPPGTEVDFFDIEKAPIPIPFGQKKDDILEHFDVVLADPGPDAPPNNDHLVCTPKPDSKLARNYSRMEFYVSRSLRLPTKIVMVANPPDSVTTAEFPDLSDGMINTGLPDTLFQLPEETRGYSVAEE